jgi:hydrogenase-4 component B
MSLVVWAMVGTVAASIAASVLAATGRAWRAGIVVALLGMAYPAGLAVASLVSGPSRMQLSLPVGVLTFSLTPWSAVWLALSMTIMGLAGLALMSRAPGRGMVVGLAWLATAVTLFLLARSPLALLVGWGLLAVGGYLLVVSQAYRRRTVASGWTMLVMSETGTAALLVGAVILNVVSSHSAGWMAAAASLGIIGLGAKAGLFPFQVWLPLAEPEAPGAAAGILSGVLSTVVLVGLWEWMTWAPAPVAVAWGLVVVGLGGAVLGVIHAMIDDDFKRVLAYSTIEWVGLAMGVLGLYLAFLHNHVTAAASLGEAAFFAILLMHLGAKTAAFTASGWMEKALGTRRFLGAGGLFRASGSLGKWLVLAVVGLMAIPPTGGYFAEWSALEGLFVAAGSALRVALVPVAIAFALIAAAGATAMLRWFGMLYLGPERRAPKLPPSRAETWLVAVGAGLAWAAGIGIGWWVPWMEANAPTLLGQRPGGVIAPVFTAPKTTLLLDSLGGRIFAGLPHTPGVIAFPGGGFTATSPWYLLFFGGGIIAVVFLLRALWWRHTGRGVSRRVSPWVGSVEHEPAHLWSATGLTLPLRLAFAPVISLRRTRQAHPTRGLVVETDTVDRLMVHVFRPVYGAMDRLTARVQATESGRLPHYVGYALGAILIGLVWLKISGF